jgi:biotin carboxyl carrier protein
VIRLKSRVGRWTLNWKTIPRGSEGQAQVEIEPGKVLNVSWRRDADGIWLQLPHGVFGFDLRGEVDESSQITYSVLQRQSHLEWQGISLSQGDESSASAGKTAKAKAIRVRAQMPGKMIRIMVKEGDQVQKDQPLAVMEAMKMENEIRATQAGVITQIKVMEGQAVESGADLLFIDGSGGGSAG